jgi:hypothetical protein
MSTNAIILIEGMDYAAIYKHWDGDPDATLPWLESFNRRFLEGRGYHDPEYKAAQLLRDSQRSAAHFSLDPSEHTGWGLRPYPAAGSFLGYCYWLRADGDVRVCHGYIPLFSVTKEN